MLNYTVIPALVAVSSTSDPHFTLICTTTGTPATVQWFYEGGSRMFENDANHQIVHSVINRMASTYNSYLRFATLSSADLGQHVCASTTTYVSSNNSETNVSIRTGRELLIYRYWMYLVGR